MNTSGSLKVSLHGGIALSRMLLIDDDPALLDGLAEMVSIRLQPVQVDLCRNPEFAVMMVQRGQHDVILCDVSMPTINGLDLLPRLRKAAPAASILLMSGVED